MKNNHLKTAVKALRRARDKYQIDFERFETDENTAKQNKELIAREIERLDKQILEIEGEPA
jgi:hypothetical protein